MFIVIKNFLIERQKNFEKNLRKFAFSFAIVVNSCAGSAETG